MLQLKRHVEMIFDSVLAAAGDDRDIANAGLNRLLDDVLDQRLVHQRQHFFGLRLCGRQKSGAESRSRENRFANLHHFREAP